MRARVSIGDDEGLVVVVMVVVVGCLQEGGGELLRSPLDTRRSAIKCASTSKLTCSRLAFIETPCAGDRNSKVQAWLCVSCR